MKNELTADEVNSLSMSIDEEISYYLEMTEEVEQDAVEEEYIAATEQEAYTECARTILKTLGEEETEAKLDFAAKYIKDKFAEVNARLEVGSDNAVSFCWG